MSTFKKAMVVILPTNKKAGLGSIYKRIKDDEIGLIDDFDKIGNLYILFLSYLYLGRLYP